MNGWQIALLVGAFVTAGVSFHISRALIWIIVAAASFVASTAYARFGLPYPAFFTAMCDAMVCLAIYCAAKVEWELRLYKIFLLSVAVSLAYLVARSAGIDVSHYWYVAALEAINWAALFLIAGTAALQWIGGSHGVAAGRGRASRLRGAYRTLNKPRHDVPFHKA